MTETSYPFAYRDYAAVLRKAFFGDPFFDTLSSGFPLNSDVDELLMQYLDYSLVEAKRYGEIYLTSNQALGASVWIKPQSPELASKQKNEKVAFLRSRLGENTLDIYNAIVESMSTQVHSVVPDHSWYLSILGVSPDARGQGLGYELVNGILEKSDRQEQLTYLETFNPNNEKFYNRLGYQTVATFFEPTIGVDYLVMTRSPNTLQQPGRE